ncbi:hypothetical protein, partial [Bordetella tumbae]|uniref:hypothetical protein n=1 Tax=Bordetella tumbae TaxID=1649139 RepID=UPI0039F0CD62
LPVAYLARRGGWANSLRFATLKHAQPTSPRLPSVALGGLNGPAAPKPLGPGTSLAFMTHLRLLAFKEAGCTSDAMCSVVFTSAGASLIPKFRDHYVQTI